MHCLETHGLFHRYSSGDIVLEEIDLQVPQGSIYGFLGPNGAGKTTTLRLILGLLKKQRGTIAIFGQSLETCRVEILRRVGVLIETPSLYDHLTARENLTLLQKVYQCPVDRIHQVLEQVGLSATGSKKVGRFSLGMKQRLGIAVALLHGPELLILDEPTNGLDPNGMIEMRDLLLRLNRENGLTILLSSHLLLEIEKLVTHLGIISRGRMVFQGTLDELKQKQQRTLSSFVCTSDDKQALKIIGEADKHATCVKGKIVLSALSKERMAGLNRRLVESGLDVHEIGTASNDLESIFLELVGG
jgi:ABC-type multidrug transport system ATPase subunit